MKLPEGYLNRMKRQLGEDFDAYMAAMAEPEKRAARCNGLKLTRAGLADLRPDCCPPGSHRGRTRSTPQGRITCRSSPPRCPPASST